MIVLITEKYMFLHCIHIDINIYEPYNNTIRSADVSQISQQPARSDGMIAVSPAGTMVAYVGADNNVYFFAADTWPYNYTGTNFSLNTDILNSLQFTSEIDLYYIAYDTAPGGVPYLNHLKYQEAYCENPAIFPATSATSGGYPNNYL